MSSKEEALALYAELGNSFRVAERTGISDSTIRYWVAIEKRKGGLKEVAHEREEQVTASHLPQKEITLLNGTVVIFSDAHVIPGAGHSVAAKALLKVLDLVHPDIVIDGGDSFDFASISKHEKLGWANQYSVKEELEAGLELLRDVSSASKGAAHYMLESNHVTRYNKFLTKHCPQFRGVKGFNFQDQLPKGWEYQLSLLINKNTIFLHGWHGGVHCSYQNVAKAGISIVTGHIHSLDVKPYVDYNGARYGISTGTLAEIQDNPLFGYTGGTPLNWMSGFVVLNYAEGILLYPELCHIAKNGKAYFRGKEMS